MPRKIIMSLALAATLSLAGCHSAPQTPLADAPLAGAAIGGPFTLTDQHGKSRTWASFHGKFVAIYFGYTFCPDVCPVDVSRTAQGIAEFKKQHPDLGEKVQQVFVTVDPARDTPEKIGQFTAAFSPDIVGLTGSAEAIARTAKEFKVYYQKGKDEGDGAYLVNHSRITYLFGPDGKPIATLPTDKGPDAVAAELAKWVR
ncbi:SCO family protein [Tsuneonella mangrovi]|uniref:SCO family protein n=1 Tax=Tsuneonella mangrovi TaxID=1982042 RepID=UPI001F0A7D4E|nr:SCO family protein [Tsuneonella mangrovi]